MLRVLRHLPPFVKREGQSDHQAVLEPLRRAIDLAWSDVEEALANTNIHSAKGKYLDAWGTVFGISRNRNEDDDSYRRRIIFEVTALRQTKKALRKVIAFYSPNLTEDEIFVFEPHTELHLLSDTFRASVSRTPDHVYWGWSIIDIHSPKPVTEEAKQKVEEYKACGVRVFYRTLQEGLDMYQTWKDFRPLSETTSSWTEQTYPLILSGSGRLSVSGIFPAESSVTIGEFFSLYTLYASDVVGEAIQGYGKDYWGKSPYGSPRTIYSYSTLEVVITNGSDFVKTDSGFGIDPYGTWPYGSPFSHFSFTVSGFEVIDQEV